MFSAFFQCCFDGIEQYHGGVFLVVGVLDAFQGLCGIDLAGKGFEGWFHERKHGGGAFTEVYQTDGLDAVRGYGYFQIEGIVVEFDGGSVDTGFVTALGTVSRIFFLSRSKHKEKYNAKDNGKEKENSRVDDFLHM